MTLTCTLSHAYMYNTPTLIHIHNTATATTTNEEEEAVTTPTLSPQDNLNKVAPLEKQLKKPPPMENRRPCKQHMTFDVELSQVCYCRYEVKFRS